MDKIYWDWPNDERYFDSLDAVLEAARAMSIADPDMRVVVVVWPAKGTRQDSFDVGPTSRPEEMVAAWMEKEEALDKERILSPEFQQAQTTEFTARTEEIARLVDMATHVAPDDYEEWLSILAQYSRRGDYHGLVLTDQNRKMAAALFAKGFVADEYMEEEYDAANPTAVARYGITHLGLACLIEGRAPYPVIADTLERYKSLVYGPGKSAPEPKAP